MQFGTDKIEKVKGLGNVWYCRLGAYDTCINDLKRKNAELISLTQLAEARVKSRNPDILWNGTLVREGAIYDVDTENIILVRNSPLLKNPQMWREMSCDQSYLYADSSIDKILKRMHKDDYLYVDRYRNGVEPERFGEDKHTLWMFGKYAKDNGLLLKKYDVHIFEIDLYYDDDYFKHDGKTFRNGKHLPVLTPLWMSQIRDSKLDNHAVLYGNLAAMGIENKFGGRCDDAIRY